MIEVRKCMENPFDEFGLSKLLGTFKNIYLQNYDLNNLFGGLLITL